MPLQDAYHNVESFREHAKLQDPERVWVLEGCIALLGQEITLKFEGNFEQFEHFLTTTLTPFSQGIMLLTSHLKFQILSKE